MPGKTLTPSELLVASPEVGDIVEVLPGTRLGGLFAGEKQGRVTATWVDGNNMPQLLMEYKDGMFTVPTGRVSVVRKAQAVEVKAAA